MWIDKGNDLFRFLNSSSWEEVHPFVPLFKPGGDWTVTF
jgi:hypothetical protein